MTIRYKDFIFSRKGNSVDMFKSGVGHAMPSSKCPAKGIKEFNEEFVGFLNNPHYVQISDFFVLRMQENYKKEEIEKEILEIYPPVIIREYETFKNTDEWNKLINKKCKKEKSALYNRICKIYDEYLEKFYLIDIIEEDE